MLFWQIFFKNFGCAFSRSNTILAISQEWLVRLMWSEKEAPLVGHWVQYMTLTFDLTHDLDLGCFKVKFRNSSYLRNFWSDWSEMKRKWVNMILGRLYDLALWPHPWPWPWNFKVRVWNSFILGMGRPIDNEWKGCESSNHDHDIDLCDHGEVGGCTGDSDRGDFRRRRAVNISSLYLTENDVFVFKKVYLTQPWNYGQPIALSCHCPASNSPFSIIQRYSNRLCLIFMFRFSVQRYWNCCKIHPVYRYLKEAILMLTISYHPKLVCGSRPVPWPSWFWR